MSGPPKDIPASTLWLKISAQERPSKVVDFPRKGADGSPIGQLAIRILTQEEQMISAAAAEEFARKFLKEAKREDLGYERLYSDGICVEVLYRACRDADDVSRPAFPTPDHIRKGLTTEECAALFQHYLTVQLELGPIATTMSDEEVEAWISRLAEGGSAFPFDTLGSDLQKLVLLHMAYRLRDSQMDSGSAGSEPDSDPGPLTDDTSLPPMDE